MLVAFADFSVTWLVDTAHVNELASKRAQHLLHNRMLLSVLAQAILFQPLFIFPRKRRIGYRSCLILNHDAHAQFLAGDLLTNLAQHFDAVALRQGVAKVTCFGRKLNIKLAIRDGRRTGAFERGHKKHFSP